MSSFDYNNPCGLEVDLVDGTGSLPTEELRNDSIRLAGIARKASEIVKRHLVENFPIDEDSLQTRYYKGLQVPSLDSLETASNETLKETFALLKNFGDTLEMMAKESAEIGDDYSEKLEVARMEVRQLMCTLQLLLSSIGIQPDKTSSNILGQLESRSKFNRDYVIIRDFIKATNYTEELLKKLSKL